MLNKIRDWFVRDEAATAIEFALVGLPFITLLMGLIEISLFFAAGVSLEGAANSAARLIRTGQVQASTNPVQTFETELCNEVNVLITCGGLQYEVIPIAGNDFSNAETMTPQFDANGNLISQGFSPGASSSDVIVRVVYIYNFLIPFVGNILTGSVGSNSSLLMSTVVIKNEPYTFGG